VNSSWPMQPRPTPLLTAFGWSQAAGGRRRFALPGQGMEAVLVALGCSVLVAALLYWSDVRPIFAIRSVEFTQPDVAVILFLLVVLARASFKGFHGLPRLIWVPLVLFFLASTLSALGASDKLRAFAALIQMFEFVALMWCASLITSPKAVLRVIHFIIGVFVFESLLGVWQFFFDTNSVLPFPHGTFSTNQKLAGG